MTTQSWLRIGMALIGAMAIGACGGNSPASMNQAGNEAFAAAEYDTALTSYEQAAFAAPQLQETQYNIGNTQFRMQQMDAAREALGSVAASVISGTVNNATPGILAEHISYNLGNVHFAGEDFEAAIEQYKAALRIDPNDQDAKVNLELALRKQQENEENQEEPTPTPSPTPSPTPAGGEPSETPTPEEPAETGTPTETMLPPTETPTGTPTATPEASEGEGETPTPAETGTPQGTPTAQQSPTPASPTPGAADTTPSPQPQAEEPVQPTLMPGELSPEQAARILDAAADQTETLQEHLQKNNPVSKEYVDKDW